jgi:hypothetical protein
MDSRFRGNDEASSTFGGYQYGNIDWQRVALADLLPQLRRPPASFIELCDSP